MIEDDELKLVQQHLYRLLEQVTRENEPAAFYGLRLAWESLQLAQGVGQFQQVARAFDEMRLGLDEMETPSALTEPGVSQAAVPLTQKQVLARELQVRLKQQAAIASIGHQALSGLDVEALTDSAANLLCEILETEYCDVQRYLPDKSAFYIQAGVGWREGYIGQLIEDQAGTTLGSYVLNSKEPVIIEDFSNEQRFNKTSLLLDHGVVSGMCVIIAGPPGSPPYGVLSVHTVRRRSFTVDDINFIQAMTNILATAIERKRIEAELQASVLEKETLLKELHHRVKNNLQAVSNLVYLQSLQVEDKSAQAAFRQTQDRIKSIALIHEKLYQASDLARIDIAEYIRSLVTSLVFSFRVDADQIRLNIKVDEVRLDGDTALVIGIIINELVTNSLKYAFPPHLARPAGELNEISVELRAESDQDLVLRVADNGVGLAEEFRHFPPDTMGLQLVYLLAQNMQGALEIERNNGAIFTIRFKSPGEK